MQDIPEGMSKPKTMPSQGNSKDSTTDTSPGAFLPSKTFQGQKEGYEFKSGWQGQGYYKKATISTTTTTTTTTKISNATDASYLDTKYQGETKRNFPPAAPAAPSTPSDSFFDMTDRHTSHLSAPSAQNVSWSSDRQGVQAIPKGLSKVKKVQQVKSGKTSSTSSSSTTRRVGVEPSTGLASSFRRKKSSPPSSAATSAPAPQNTNVSFDIVFIMNQLALGKITQEQFDLLNAKLM
jgi:hypothetical protein